MRGAGRGLGRLWQTKEETGTLWRIPENVVTGRFECFYLATNKKDAIVYWIRDIEVLGMIIKEVYIERFRAINDLTLPLGNKITAIAGQNGTMKTTILGIIGQPFSLRQDTSPLSKAMTIEGTKFESQFKDKFKMSYPDYDKVGEHKWKLFFQNTDIYPEPFIEIESIRRSEPQKSIDDIRFWPTQGRETGMGYVQCPVIYLSLKRMTPIGEERSAKKQDIELSEEEIQFYNRYHNDILVLEETNLTPEYINSPNKKTLGAKTEKYDAFANSAGQDNIGKILLAILSFRRLQSTYPDDYKGGILLIDELESTLFPAAQRKMLQALVKFSRDYHLQIIFTTHSLYILESISEYDKRNGDLKLLYLEKRGDNITVHENPELEAMQNDILIKAKSNEDAIQKITVYCEDEEARLFLLALLPQKYRRRVHLAKENMGCGNLKSLAKRGIKEFTQNIVVLDGDTSLPRGMGNFVKLPGRARPENVLFDFLQSLPAEHDFWQSFGEGGYTRQFCFQDFRTLDRDTAKKWFGSQKPYWGQNLSKVMKYWKDENKASMNNFINSFEKTFNYVATKKGLPIIV